MKGVKADFLVFNPFYTFTIFDAQQWKYQRGFIFYWFDALNEVINMGFYLLGSIIRRDFNKPIRMFGYVLISDDWVCAQLSKGLLPCVCVCGDK